MSVDQSSGPGHPLNTNQAILGGLLIGAGTVITVTGFAVVSSALSAALRELRDPTTAAMRRTWEHARAATVAGTRAWHDGNVPEERTTA